MLDNQSAISAISHVQQLVESCQLLCAIGVDRAEAAVVELLVYFGRSACLLDIGCLVGCFVGDLGLFFHVTPSDCVKGAEREPAQDMSLVIVSLATSVS